MIIFLASFADKQITFSIQLSISFPNLPDKISFQKIIIFFASDMQPFANI